MIACLGILVGCGVCIAREQESRTWTSKDGTQTLEGAFFRVEGDNVLVKLSGGQIRKEPVAFMSEADQKFVSSISKNPSAASGEPEQK